MKSIKTTRRILSKTFAIAEKNFRTQFRFKFNVILNWIAPIITILMPIIILDKFFDYNTEIGPWTPDTFIIFVFIGYNILIMQRMISYIPKYLLREKYWKTLSALITSPFNRYYLLFGYIFSEFLEILIPFTLFLITMLIILPISIPTLLVVLLMFFGIGVVFSGLGLFLGVFAVSNENILAIFDLSIRFVFWLSCVTYPFQLFPTELQNIINLNPIYYLIDIIRLTWIDNNLIVTVSSHSLHFLVFASSLIIFPIICVILFNRVFKRLGIRGY